MDVKAQHRHVRMSPRKVRLLREVVCGLSAVEAEAQLQFLPGKAAKIVRKVLQSAVANAEHNFDMVKENLHVKDVVVDSSFILKRFMPVSKGMAHEIKKRNSHVTVVVTDGSQKARKGKKVKADVVSVKELKSSTEQVNKKVEKNEKGESQVERIPQNKDEMASQKKRAQQTGGNRRKAVRRKSMGDSK